MVCLDCIADRVADLRVYRTCIRFARISWIKLCQGSTSSFSRMVREALRGSQGPIRLNKPRAADDPLEYTHARPNQNLKAHLKMKTLKQIQTNNNNNTRKNGFNTSFSKESSELPQRRTSLL